MRKRLHWIITVMGLMFASGLLAVYAENASADETGNLTLIHAGQLLAKAGNAPLPNQTIYVRGGKIEKIITGFQTEDGAQIIDLKDQFVLPGLIDSHVHLAFEFGPNIRLETVTKRPGDLAYDALINAQKTLLAGFTAVQDVGGPYEVFALRDAINAQKVAGPHIRASGPAITPTGGHGDIHGYRLEVLQALARPNLCDGVADCRRATRNAIKMGADVIKITATGGVLSNTNAGTKGQFFQDEIEAIVGAASKMGRQVTAHAHGKDGIETALKSGVNSIEHGSYLDKGTTALFKQHDAVLIPTLLAGQTVVEWAKQGGILPPASSKKAIAVGPQMTKMFKTAYDNGVSIAFGTDTGVSKHGENAREFALMVAGGMSEMEAIKSATLVAAKHLQMSDKIGTIEAGKLADIIAVAGNPLDDISELEHVDFVMKEGVVYKTP